jgi:hypothetical protein
VPPRVPLPYRATILPVPGGMVVIEGTAEGSVVLGQPKGRLKGTSPPSTSWR